MKTETQLTLHQALLQLQQLNAAIRLTPRSITIWAPNKRVPSLIRSTIVEHKAEIREMIQASRIEVCPSPKWHRHEWHFPLQDWLIDSATCGVCQRLATINEVVPNKSNFEKIKIQDERTHAVSTQKLRIQQLSILKGDWAAITFTGPQEPYTQLCKDLGKEKHFNAYWHPGQGWMISSALLPKYADRFDNLQTKLDEAKAAIPKPQGNS
jgi:hypothetical protein